MTSITDTVRSLETIKLHLKGTQLKGDFTDYRIIAGNKVFPVHKDVLNNYEHFREIFADGSSTDLTEYTQHTAKAVEICLIYIYKGKLKIEPYQAAEVIGLSHLWNLDIVTTKCEKMLKNQVNRGNSVEMRRLASQTKSRELGEAANESILRNKDFFSGDDLRDLSLEDIESIKDFVLTSDFIRVKDFWVIFDIWNTSVCRDGQQRMCENMKIFPFGNITTNTFKECVWSNDHISKCEEHCKILAASTFLSSMKNILKGDDIIFLKYLAKTYGCNELDKAIHKYIVNNHKEIFVSECMKDIQRDDLVKCLRDINDACTAQEFTCIVAWMESDPDRHSVFQDLFEFVEYPDRITGKDFLSSLFAFVGFSEGTDEELQCCDQEKSFWWPKYGFFLKNLAKSYSYRRTEGLIDVCIMSDFAKVTEDPRFLDFEFSDLKKYFSTCSTYESDENAVWNGFMSWIHYDLQNRKQYFIEIFKNLKLEKFSPDFLTSSILENDLVIESNRSMALVMKYIITSRKLSIK